MQAIRTSCRGSLMLHLARPCLLPVAVLLPLAWTPLAEPLQLRPAQTILAAGTTLDVGDHAVPCVTDWNGDGRKDLVVGFRSTDKIAVFLNQGTDDSPVLTSGFNLQAAGVDIYLPGSGCGGPAPWVCDLDADGQRDLLVGDGANGRVYFYRNTHSDAQPVLAAGIELLAGTASLTVLSRATPFVHDWDEDGHPDLLCGCGEGSIYLFRNTGTLPSPAFANGVKLENAGTPLLVGARSVPRVWDWDHDGLKDLVCSSSTGVYWCRNVGDNSTPALQPPVALTVPSAAGALSPIYTGYRMRLNLTDWNNDGHIDILLGNADGTVFLYEGYRFALTPPLWLASDCCVLQWNSASFLRYQVLAGSSPTDIRTVLAGPVPSDGNTTRWTNETVSPAQFFRVQLLP